MRITEFSPKQQLIFSFISDPNRYLICDGAVRSGKTVPMAIAFILFAMLHFKNVKFAICSKTTRTAERNILDPLFSIDGLPFNLNYNRGTRVLTASWSDTKNEFHIFGANDEKSSSKIQGITLDSIFLDEVVLMPESFVNQAIARLLTNPLAKVWFSCNPESPQHWFYKNFIESKKPGTRYIHFDMTDNPIMTPEAIEQARASFTGIFKKRYIDGIWCIAEGAIYPLFAENKSDYFCTPDDIRGLDCMTLTAGLDFGGNKSQHAIVISAIDIATRNLYVLHAESFRAENVTPDELYSKVKAVLTAAENDYGPISALYADSAEQTLINGLKSKIKIPVRNSIKEPINDRIRVTTSLMASGRFHLVKGRCQMLAEALESAVWNDKKLNDERLDNGSYNVDILDAFEYSFERSLRALARIY